VIVDAHTHIFPPAFLMERDTLLGEEVVFAELYASPRASMATADDLLDAMDEAGVECALIAGFAWTDFDRCRRHNDALLEAAARSNGRLVALCGVPAGDPDRAVREMERSASAGARGFGELRLSSTSAKLFADDALASVAGAAVHLGLPLMIHASEPVGHRYPGKAGGPLERIWRLREDNPDVTLILAHLGGGLPFYAFMPEVAAQFQRTYVDTAATPWLYRPEAYRAVLDLIGHGHLLFGSDFPLRHPRDDIRLLLHAGLSDDQRRAVLGGNADRLFHLGGV
jgi:predicted TIM-barrel fold metal-dependent hydrolase